MVEPNDPPGNSIPAPITVLAAATCFLAFCMLGGFAIAFPTHGMGGAISAFGVLSFLGLVGLTFTIGYTNVPSSQSSCSLNKPCLLSLLEKRVYSKNLANSVILFMLTIPTMIALYDKVWCPISNLWIEQIHQESMGRLFNRKHNTDTNVNHLAETKFQSPAVILMEQTDEYTERLYVRFRAAGTPH